MSSNSSTPSINNASGASTATFITALWLNAAVFAAEILAFTLLRPRFKAIYEPRTYIPVEKRRSQPITHLFTWPWTIFKTDYNLIKLQNGLDAYFFVRYLRMMVKIFLPIWLVSWAILLPAVSVKSTGGLTGLNMFTFGNVGKNQQSRYAAHIILVWVFTFYIFYVVKSEMKHFVTTRQRFLVDPEHSASAQANTILITGVPPQFLREKALFQLFSHLPGGVKKVWLNRDLKDLPKVYDRRLAACNKLESAETGLLNKAAKLRRKELKKQGKSSAGGASNSNDGLVTDSNGDAEKNITLAEQLVPKDKRPSHRLPAGFLPFSLPFIGKKVDSIDWAREEIAITNEELEKGRHVLRQEVDESLAKQGRVGGVAGLANVLPLRIGSDHGHGVPEHVPTEGKGKEVEGPTYPPLNSAFILFNQQIAAHLAAQTLTHNEPYRMAAKYTEIAPADVIWGNLGLVPYEMKIRTVISYLITAALVIAWSIPVAFVGTVSNISALSNTYHWLAWFNKLPSTVTGIIQGVLPPVLLAVLMMLLPIVLRLLARFEGIPRKTGLELSLMTRFFIFQVVHSFLIVSISSGIIAALPNLVKNPTGIPGLLAMKLPQASTFFLTYAILQGLSGTAAGFLQAVALIIYYVKLFLLGSTPRSVYNIKFTMRSVAWGTLFPSTTLITVIALGYSIISPVINGLACVTFFLFYQMYKYLFLYQLDQPASGDTGGLFFPKAIQHMFVGLYVQQIVLAALFFLAQNDKHKPSAVPEGALMVILIFVTAFYHYMTNDSYDPLLHSLPLSLADHSHGIHAQNGQGGAAGASGIQGDGAGQAQGIPHAHDARSSRDAHGNMADSDMSAAERKEAGEEYALEQQRGQRMRSNLGEPLPQKQAEDEPTDFYHPAAVEPQQIVWLPRDTLGLAEAEVAANRGAGIEVSTDNAYMDEKGHVDISGPPPGVTLI